MPWINHDTRMLPGFYLDFYLDDIWYVHITNAMIQESRNVCSIQNIFHVIHLLVLRIVYLDLEVIWYFNEGLIWPTLTL